jgi:Carboxypeptidase regulatory-like domain
MMSFEQNRHVEGGFGKLAAPISRQRRAILCQGMLLSALVAWGCSGIVSGQNTTASQPPPQTFSISGTITPVTGGNGATITFSGGANATTTANSSGNFTISGLANGTYTITPSHAGYSFSPGSMNVTISNASVTTGINFTATALTFGISGTLSPAASGSGATVTLSGAASATTTADGAGNYIFSGLSNGMYAVTPSHTGYSFSPSVQTATVNGANVTSVNFTANPQVAHTVALSWNASTSSTVSGYYVYRSTTSGSGYAKVNSLPVVALVYIDSTIQNATTYYYVTTAVDANGVESTFSNEVSAAIP